MHVYGALHVLKSTNNKFVSTEFQFSPSNFAACLFFLHSETEGTTAQEVGAWEVEDEHEMGQT